MPNRAERLALIKKLQLVRGTTHVITYLTSTRSNLEVQMAMDAIPRIYDHLRAIKTAKDETRIDIFIHSNGGDGIVPWRIVTLAREFCAELNVLVPHRAFSAATLLALGADNVIMHPMGILGPTDPTVFGPFNPPNPQNAQQLLGISVEDVSSYIGLVKEDVGIRHEDELVQAFRALAEKVHPLALGNVKRSTSQSRMMGAKLLKQRGTREPLADHEVAEIVDKLTSRLYYHGHPISRTEAREELGLKFVKDATAAEADAMWALYKAYDEEMRLDEEFQFIQEAMAGAAPAVPAPPPMVNPGQLGMAAITTNTTAIAPIKAAYVESAERCDVRLLNFEVTTTRDWTGAINGNAAMIAQSWAEEA